MEVVPLSDFHHGPRAFRTNIVENISESLANDLERAGLVRVKMTAPPPRTQEAPPRRTQEQPPARRQDAPPPTREPAPGKAPADGEGTPSASLPAAPASPLPIANLQKRGRGRPRKIVT